MMRFVFFALLVSCDPFDSPDTDASDTGVVDTGDTGEVDTGDTGEVDTDLGDTDTDSVDTDTGDTGGGGIGGGGIGPGDTDTAGPDCEVGRFVVPGCGLEDDPDWQVDDFPAGCYVECSTPGAACSDGTICTTVVENPCVCEPGQPCCAACGELTTMCL